eukprot:2011291-Amphidinium_carterae.1
MATLGVCVCAKTFGTFQKLSEDLCLIGSDPSVMDCTLRHMAVKRMLTIDLLHGKWEKSMTEEHSMHIRSLLAISFTSPRWSGKINVRVSFATDTY